MNTNAPLPTAHLESLRFKAAQIIESIIALQRTLDSHPAALPPWPDILGKFTVLLSQTHHFSTALLPPRPIGTNSHSATGAHAGAGGSGPRFANIALHPSAPLPDPQLDNTLIPLLRNQQTTDVLRIESASVRRLASHMPASLSGPGPSPDRQGHGYAAVLAECEQIRRAHDQRVERAMRAVTMLRERFEWRQRVEVEVEEPEELEWDPRLGAGVGGDAEGDADGEVDPEGDADADGEGDVGMEGQSSDEDEVEELVELTRDVEGDGTTPGAATEGLFSFGDVEEGVVVKMES